MPFNIPWFHPHSLSIRLPGLGVQVYPSGAKVYVVQTRAFGRSKRVTVGRHGTLTPDEARKQAARIIARIKAGESPVLNGPIADPTVAAVGPCGRDDPSAGADGVQAKRGTVPATRGQVASVMQSRLQRASLVPPDTPAGSSAPQP